MALTNLSVVKLFENIQNMLEVIDELGISLQKLNDLSKARQFDGQKMTIESALVERLNWVLAFKAISYVDSNSVGNSIAKVRVRKGFSG